MYCTPPPPIDSWICIHAPACENTWLATVIFKLVGVNLAYIMNLLLYFISFFAWFIHERGFLYMHTPHQHANSTPPFWKVWLRAWKVSWLTRYGAGSCTITYAGLSSHTHWECDTLISLPSHSHTHKSEVFFYHIRLILLEHSKNYLYNFI